MASTDAGETVLHVFLEVEAGALRERLDARDPRPDKNWDEVAREAGMTGVDEIVAAAARQPSGTLMLRSDLLTPAELADEVLEALRARAHRRVASTSVEKAHDRVGRGVEVVPQHAVAPRGRGHARCCRCAGRGS